MVQFGVTVPGIHASPGMTDPRLAALNDHRRHGLPITEPVATRLHDRRAGRLGAFRETGGWDYRGVWGGGGGHVGATGARSTEPACRRPNPQEAKPGAHLGGTERAEADT